MNLLARRCLMFKKLFEIIFTPVVWVVSMFSKEHLDKALHKEILRANGYKYDMPRIHRD